MSRITEDSQASIIGFRHVQAFLLFLGMAFASGVRANMSIAIVGMTTPPNYNGNTSQTEHGYEYLDWPISFQGVVLSSFIVGYVVTQPAGYFLASKFGGKLLVVVGVAVSAALSAFIPLGAYDGGWKLLCLCRGIQGLAQGTMMPAILHLLENWFPQKNRSPMETLIVMFGMQLGTGFQFLISGFIIKYWDWELSFFIHFIAGVVWSIIYVILGSSSPEISKFINENEKIFLRNSLIENNERKNLKMPWHALWTSLPVLALVLACCAQQWGQWTFMTMVPIYLNQAHNADIAVIGILTAVPYLAMFMMIFPFHISNFVIRKKCFTPTVTHKIFNSIGFLGPAVCLLVISEITFDLTVTAFLLTLMMAFNAAQYSRFIVNLEQIAPNFSGTLNIITFSLADILSAFAPLTASKMLEKQEISNWSDVFQLSAALYIACGLFYVMFGSSVKQAWNDNEMHTHTIGMNTRTK